MYTDATRVNRARGPGRGWRHGLAAAAAGLGTIELLCAARGRQSFVDAAGELVIDHGPRPVVERTVELLQTFDKPVIRAAVTATVLAAGGLLGRAPRRSGRDVTLIAALATAGAATRRRKPMVAAPAGDRIDTAATAVTGGVATLAVLRAAGISNPIAGALGVAGLLAAQYRQAALRHRHQDRDGPGAALRPAEPLPPARDGAEHWRGVSPLLTPLSDFYVTDVNMRAPVIDPHRWRLAISGAVAAPVSLTYEQLTAGDLVEFDAAMVCIHNRLGGNRLGNQRWTGIPLTRLLQHAGGPAGAATTLVTRAVDGWEASLPLDLLSTLDGYLVVGMAGQPLTPAHGFPARLFFPGIYGQYTGAKWLVELRLQSEPNLDYWLPRGWPHGPARVRPMSRIDAPTAGARVPAGLLEVTGVAWAPPHGVQVVEVAVDDQPWTHAELAGELAPTAWRRWRARIPLDAGPHHLRTRCHSQDGTVQDHTPRLPFPTGASGYQRVTITATTGSPRGAR